MDEIVDEMHQLIDESFSVVRYVYAQLTG